MIIFNCTKTASQFFGCPKQGLTPPFQEAPGKDISEDEKTIRDSKGNKPSLSQWLIHQVEANGQPIVIATELSSRFSMTFTTIKEGDAQTFLRSFYERWMSHMQLSGEKIGLMNKMTVQPMYGRLLAKHGESRFFIRGDRSAQISVKDIAERLNKYSDEQPAVLKDLNEQVKFDQAINSQPKKSKGSKKAHMPSLAMFETWLKDIVAMPDREIQQAKARMMLMG